MYKVSYSSVPHKCPICMGSGIVPGGFYSAPVGHVQGWVSTNTTEQCRQCCGSGVIWSVNVGEKNEVHE